MRLFISLDFDEHKDYFIKLQQQFSGFGKFTFPKSFHITLKFLGEVPDADVAKIKAALEAVKFKSFHVKLDSLGVFPNTSYMRVIWIGIEPTETAIALQKQIDSVLGKPDKKFHPHITLARVKYVKDKLGLLDFLKSKVEEKTTHLNYFSLMKSTLAPKGPIYESIAKFVAE